MREEKNTSAPQSGDEVKKLAKASGYKTQHRSVTPLKKV